MKRIATILGICIFTLSITSCHKKAIKGEGPIVSETRSLANFSKIQANGSTDIIVVKDSVYKVIVTGYSNLVPVYETRVSGDRLILEQKDLYWNVRNDNISVEVHTPYVDYTSMNGSGNINIYSGFIQDNFEAKINGSGDITVSNNQYITTDIDINGSGRCNMETCEAERVNTKISGSGDIYVKVSEYLKVRISGSGDVYYRGNPIIESNISGSGEVHSRN